MKHGGFQGHLVPRILPSALNKTASVALSTHRDPGDGGVPTGEPVAMWAIVPLDRTMQLPLTLAGGLRTTFADVVSSPLPERWRRSCTDYMPIARNAQGRSATMGHDAEVRSLAHCSKTNT
jgi:hypothetical protein